MTSKLLSRRDIEFLLYEWLDVESLCTRPRFSDHSRGTFDGALDTAERIATEGFLPHRRKSDVEEPEFDGERVRLIPEVGQAFAAFAEAGLLAGPQGYEFGGMQLPLTVHNACFAYVLAANVGSAGYPLLTAANANLLLAHGSPAQIDAFARPELEGRFAGTMCLSEPQAGSSLADVATRAEPDGDSPFGAQFRLFGNKMWISAGEHEVTENIVHLVLARIPGAPPGVKGISLFIVPRRLVGADGTCGERNDVALAGLNHKMGYRGTVNTLLNFGEGRYRPDGRPGAIGYLVGEAHRGLGYMFHMMNEARIGVGLGAVALGYAGYLESLEYARNRPQGRPLTSRDPSSAPVRIIEHADVRRMLLAQKAYVEGGLALSCYCARLVDDEATAESEPARSEAHLLLEILTPIAKSWPSQWCLAANDLAIQVLGVTATRATTRSSNSTVTTASTRFTKARTASRRSTCSAARCRCRAARPCTCSAPVSRRPSGRRGRRGMRTSRAGLQRSRRRCSAWRAPPARCTHAATRSASSPTPASTSRHSATW